MKTYRGSMLWRFDNFGFAVTGAAIGDVDGDRHPEVIVASETGYLYVLNAAGRKEWHIDFGDALCALKLADLNRDGLFEIIIGGDNSCVAVVDSQGRIASWQLETAKVMKIEVSDSDSNKAVTPIILIATSNGQLVAYSGSVK
ncbi:MAG TPA: VCBS repeat-containing protein [Armatimonadetes bacterium]|nr:VCBS repeat-containing protein [Armatimonadota bacterium]